MNTNRRRDVAEMTAWLQSVRQASVGETGALDTRTAEEAESGVDISQLRANLRMTPEQRLAKMVAAATFFASVRGTVRRRHAR